MGKIITTMGYLALLLTSLSMVGCTTDSIAVFREANPETTSSVTANEQKNAQGSLMSAAEWTDDQLLFTPDQLEKMKIPVEAKGIYLTGRSAGNSNFQRLLQFVVSTELNAMVIDVKEDEGRVTYKSGVPVVKEVGSDNTVFIQDVDSVVQTLKENHIYPIARIVCFKDPFLAGKKTDWAMHKKTGGVWSDKKGTVWIDPYRKEVWDYNIAIAKEAAQKGFKEIQFDYVRFPDNGKKIDAEVAFHEQNGKEKQQVIADFLAYAKAELAPFNVYISADVFGLVPSVSDDMGIGQKWEMVSPNVDYISPMTYPSHYANGTYGLRVPDAKPYETILHSVKDAQQKNAGLEQNQIKSAAIRPWLQDFTARWVKGHIPYGPAEVSAQIKAAKDLGVDQYLIWNAGNTYSQAAWPKR